MTYLEIRDLKTALHRALSEAVMSKKTTVTAATADAFAIVHNTVSNLTPEDDPPLTEADWQRIGDDIERIREGK